VSDATVRPADLTTFARLDELGLEVTGQLLGPEPAVLECRVVDPDEWCCRCGCQGRVRDSVTRRLAHEPLGWRPTELLLRVRRYRCTECGHVWRQDTSQAAPPRAKISRREVRWALEGIVCVHLSMSRVATGLEVAWHTANTAVLDKGRRVLIGDDTRFDNVAVIGVDEHAWRHTRRAEKYVTVIIDLTPVGDGTGPGPWLRGHTRRPIQGRVQDLAGRPTAGLAQRPGGGRNGRLLRVQDRHHRRTARRGLRDGPLPSCASAGRR
jgi:hypothetical protein